MLRSKTLPALAAAAVLVSACGDDGGGSDTVQPGEYASDICTAFLDWRDSIQERQGDLQEGLRPGITPEEGKEALEGFLTDAVEASDELVEQVEAAGTPDTENGEQAAEALTGAAEQARTELQEARENLDDLPTDNRAEFGRAADRFGDNVRNALQGVGDGLEEIDSPELDRAFDEEEACQS